MHDPLWVDQQQTAAVLNATQLCRAIALLIGIGRFDLSDSRPREGVHDTAIFIWRVLGDRRQREEILSLNLRWTGDDRWA